MKRKVLSISIILTITTAAVFMVLSAFKSRENSGEKESGGSCPFGFDKLGKSTGEVLKGEGEVPTKLWVAPPTKMDEAQLTEEGYYAIFAAAGARLEMPGCSLCMGNQAQVSEGAAVFSTSTRNFDNRLGKGSQVYLGSAEVAAVAALLGRLPTKEEYMKIVPEKITEKNKDGVYKYLNFHQVSQEQLTGLMSSR